MIELREECEKLLIHINRCKIAMDIDGYVYAGIIGYFIRWPFKKMHRYHFAKIEIYADKIINYIKENELDLSLERFQELKNTGIIYNAQQVSSLGYKDYQHRIEYLDNLKGIITKVLESSN